MSTASIAELKTIQNELGQMSTDILERVKLLVETKTKDLKIDPTFSESFTKLSNRVDDFEKKFYRPNLAGGSGDKAEGAERKRILIKSLRYGGQSLTAADKDFLKKTVDPSIKGEISVLNQNSTGPMETKTLIESDDTLGGYLAFPEFVDEITKGVVLYSPVRALARIRQTANREVRIPKRTGTFAAVWTAEQQTLAETTGLTYGMNILPVHELQALVDISNPDMDDSAFDLAKELQMEFSEQFAKGEGAAFINGTSISQPQGILTQISAQSSQVDTTASASALTYTGFVRCAYNLPTFYAQNATWGMNRATLGLTRQIVDGQSRPIWMPFSTSGMDVANPPTILGIPYQEMPDMPVVAANAYPVILADWKKCYYIVDRVNMDILRDPYSQSSRNVIRFIARKRVGGQVALVEAARVLQIATP